MRTQWIGNCRSEEILASGERHRLQVLLCRGDAGYICGVFCTAKEFYTEEGSLYNATASPLVFGTASLYI